MEIRSRLARLFRKGEAGGPRVLLYHRVFEPVRDPQLLCVTPERFAAQMEWLSMNSTILALPTMMRLARRGSLPRNAVALTFDDGYFDNAEIAGPILGKYEVPATIFVSSGFVDSSKGMWWDDLEHILLGDASLPESLVVTVASDTLQWDLRGNVHDDAWNVAATPSTAAQEAYLSISRKLRYMPPQGREKVLDQLRRQTSATAEARATHRGVTSPELMALGSNGLIEIGGHTVDHVALSALSRDEQTWQIESDKARLETMVGTSLGGFAYPYGTETEYDSGTASAVNDAGYVYACANVPGVITGSTPVFEIPRQIVRNWSVHKFSGMMRQWLG